MIHTGDCIAVMRTMDADSVDAVVTDPPYNLSFMGKGWDRFRQPSERDRQPGAAHNSSTFLASRGLPESYIAGTPFQAWCQEWGTEALRVTKPGGYLLAFGGTRTHHRLVCGLEDAGWIIRDELDWIYASGFPKGKANLKPAHEPIVLARKPGPLRPLNIEETRIGYTSESDRPTQEEWNRAGSSGKPGANGYAGQFSKGMKDAYAEGKIPVPSGRWPSNVLLSSPELFDEPNPWVVGSGATSDSGGRALAAGDQLSNQFFREMEGRGDNPIVRATAYDRAGDSGGYSRFFIIPKADRADREPVLGGLPEGLGPVISQARRGRCIDCGHWKERAAPNVCPCGGQYEYESNAPKVRQNTHATVKPTDLMRHLIRLVTPPTVKVIYCPHCDISTDVRPVRANVRAEAATTVLLDEVSSGVPEAGQDVPTMRDGVLGEGSNVRPDVLLEGVRGQGGDPPAEAVRGVSDAVSAGDQSGAVLFEDLRDAMDSSTASKVAGIREESGGLHPGAEYDSSELIESGLHHAASASDGRRAEPAATANRGRRSPERDQGRQPAGESAGSVEARSRQPQEAAAQADHLPSLPVDDIPVGPCPVCGGSRTARERRGLVLDPFGGSGSTAIAAELEGFDWILVEKEPEYVAIAEARLNGTQRGLGLDTPLVGEPRKSVDGVAVRRNIGISNRRAIYQPINSTEPLPDVGYGPPKPGKESESPQPGMFDEEPAA